MSDFLEPPLGFDPRQLLNEAHREIANYTAIFVFNDGRIGSGTFLNAYGSDGILTAHHVARVACNSPEKEFGLIVANHLHQLFLPVAHVEHVVIGDSTNNASPHVGPDLSFLKILDSKVLGTLRSKKSFLYLETNERNFSRYGKAPFDRQLWAIAGSPYEFAEASGTLGTPEWILKASNFVGDAPFRSLVQRDGFDYIELQLVAGEHGFPGSYAGMSGGGMWFVPFSAISEQQPDTIRYEAPVLAGVTYYQSELENGERIITGHGPSSIHTSLVQALKNSTG